MFIHASMVFLNSYLKTEKMTLLMIPISIMTDCEQHQLLIRSIYDMLLQCKVFQITRVKQLELSVINKE